MGTRRVSRSSRVRPLMYGYRGDGTEQDQDATDAGGAESQDVIGDVGKNAAKAADRGVLGRAGDLVGPGLQCGRGGGDAGEDADAGALAARGPGEHVDHRPEVGGGKLMHRGLCGSAASSRIWLSMMRSSASASVVAAVSKARTLPTW